MGVFRGKVLPSPLQKPRRAVGMSPHVVGFSPISSRRFACNHFGRISVRALLCFFLFAALCTTRAAGAERFYISIPGPALSYVPLYYGQEKGFFAQEGLD